MFRSRSSPTPVRPPTEPSIHWPTQSDPGTNGEATTTTRDRLRAELENDPGSYPTLIPWLDSHLGGDSEDPTGQLVKVPDCRGDSYSECASRLDAKDLTPRRVELDLEDADLDLPADVVVRTDPAKQAAAGSEVDVLVNPPAERMPMRLPGSRGTATRAARRALKPRGSPLDAPSWTSKAPTWPSPPTP